MNILLQNVNTPEVRAISHACMLEDIKVHRVGLEMLRDLNMFGHELLTGEFLPVGSVEFVRAAFNVIGMEEPNMASSYTVLDKFLHRKMTKDNVSLLSYLLINPTNDVKLFIKPVQTKLFNGFVFESSKKDEEYDEHDREQLKIIDDLNPFTELLYFEYVEFVSEYRVYVDEKTIIGYARYDPDGADDAPEPDWEVVNEMINEYNSSTTYALDVGVLKNGKTALVEVNDAWAIGLYGKALTPKQYLEFLAKRWNDMFARFSVKKSKTEL